jgi:hypothetical protein
MTDREEEYYLGIDPGVSGGIAMVNRRGRVVQLAKMPTTDQDVLELLGDGGTFAILERVHSMPKQGHNGAFTFGRNYGALQMALAASNIPFDLVTPQKWQTAMGCLTGGDKNVSKRRAQQLFPGITITHAVADALLIAEYCRRIRTGTHVEKESREAQGQTQGQEQTQRKRLAQSQAQGI